MENFTHEEIEVINSLQNKLYEEAELLHQVTTSLQEDFDNNDPEAHSVLNMALSHATHYLLK